MDVFGVPVDSVREAIGLAKDGFGLVKEASGVAGKLRDVFSGSKEKAPDFDTVSLASDLAQKLLNAQVAQSEIMNRLLELEAALKEADRREAEAQRYTLVSLPEGVFVMALKEADPKGEPLHYLCQQCFEAGKKHILQPSFGISNHVECPTCKIRLRTRSAPAAGPGFASYDFDPLGDF